MTFDFDVALWLMRRPPRPVSTPSGNPYQVDLQRFVDCIGGRADPQLLDADRAIEALELSLATQRALYAGGSAEIDADRLAPLLVFPDIEGHGGALF